MKHCHHLRARETRALYSFEATIKLSPTIEQDRPIAELRALARRVWVAEGRSLVSCPTLIAHEGDRYYNGRFCSWSSRPWNTIGLSRNQRNVKILLHELAHALGPQTHGVAFVRRYFGLLVQHAKVDPGFLLTTATKLKVAT